MRLLIITQYFPPEMGAPQARLYELAKRLQDIQRIPPQMADSEVLTMEIVGEILGFDTDKDIFGFFRDSGRSR